MFTHAGLQEALLLSMGGQLSKRLLGVLPVTVVYLSNILCAVGLAELHQVHGYLKHVPRRYGWAVLLNLLGCVWLFTARCEGYENSWLTSIGEADLLFWSVAALQHTTSACARGRKQCHCLA